MASAGGTGEGSSKTLPNWVAKSLECPVCLEPMMDPPIYQCEKGHGMCSRCRETINAQNKPCPVCRGKLTDARNVVVENILEQLPKIKCKHEGCHFKRSDPQQVKIHEEEECRERPVFCLSCQTPIAMSKLFGHLETKHGWKPLCYTSLGQEFLFKFRTNLQQGCKLVPLGKVNDLEFIVNREPYGENIAMIWISLNGSAQEANQFEYTLKLWNKDRTKILALKTTDCQSTAMSRVNVKRKATALFVTRDDMKEAESNVKKLKWTVVIEKK